MSIIMVHGIATSGGGLFELGHRLELLGYDIKYPKYERRHFWSYWFKGTMRRDGASLVHSEEYNDGDSVICHSNGQLVVESAIRAGAKFNKVFIFSGAGASDEFIWPEGSVNEVHWYVNISDLAVWFGSLLPFDHPFGRAARIGYAGTRDDRHTIHKFDRDKWFNIDHSFWFSAWINRTVCHIQKYLDKSD